MRSEKYKVRYMKTKKGYYWLLILALGITVSSCTPVYYMANSGVEPIVFTKPIYRDTATVTAYIGGKFAHSIDSAFNHVGETNYYGQLYYFRTHTNKYHNFSYGGYGYMGEYNVQAVKAYRGKKNYYGGGLSGDINLNLPLKFLDYRIIGIKGTVFYEDGDFRKFKMLASKQYLVTSNASQFGYNVSIISSIDIKLNKWSSIGISTALGISGEINSNHQFFTNSSILNYQNKRVTLFLQETSYYFGIGDEFALGLNYRL